MPEYMGEVGTKEPYLGYNFKVADVLTITVLGLICGLLDLLDISGAIVVADALNCQKATAKKIVEKGGAYLLSVKKNQLRKIVLNLLKTYKAENGIKKPISNIMADCLFNEKNILDLLFLALLPLFVAVSLQN